jgi:hypothetical protein
LAKASAELINPEKALTATIPNCSPRHCAQGGWTAGEEILFRGWRRSRRDVWLVIVVTALLWAVVHLQYDPYVIAYLPTGWARMASLGNRLNDPDHAAGTA